MSLLLVHDRRRSRPSETMLFPAVDQSRPLQPFQVRPSIVQRGNESALLRSFLFLRLAEMPIRPASSSPDEQLTATPGIFAGSLAGSAHLPLSNRGQFSPSMNRVEHPGDRPHIANQKLAHPRPATASAGDIPEVPDHPVLPMRFRSETTSATFLRQTTNYHECDRNVCR